MRTPNRAASVPPPLVVHEAHRPPAPVLRFVDQVAGSATPDVEFRFSQAMPARFDVDIVHVIEPNLDTFLGTRRVRRHQRVLAYWAFTRNLRRSRVALVRTLTSADRPHSRHPIDRLSGRILDRATSAFIVLDGEAYTPEPSRTTVIPHASYHERFIGYPHGEMVPGRVLCVASEYLPAGVEGLLAVPRATDTPGVTLRLAGRATRALESPIRSALAQHSSVVSARLESLSDGARVQEIDCAELVIVPRVEDLDEWQTVFLALTRNRPVLTPRTDEMQRLSEEVGRGWIHLSDGPITAKDIDRTLASPRSAADAPSPNLLGRSLAATAEAHAEVFRASAHPVE